MEPENRELLEQVVINEVDGAATSQYMINSELLQTHGHHGLVVDISGGEFIPVNYTSEDIMNQDLTEEDRNLAAALVAVQLSQQQKQSQQGGAVLPSIVSTGSGSATLATPAKLLEGGEDAETQHLLLDKDAAGGYLQIVGSTDGIYVEKAMPKVAAKPSKGAPVFPVEDHVFEEYEEITLAQIKTDEEKKDSDGESAARSSETRSSSSKKSLPHKKRISRKLKKASPPQQPPKRIQCTLCDGEFTAGEFAQHEETCQPPANALKCQICDAPFTDQLKFFEHLKRHYEPPTKATEPETTVKEIIVQLPDKLLKKDDGKWEQPDSPPQAVSPAPAAREPKSGGNQSELLLSSLLCLTCIECNKTFRRQKTFEQHMRDVHSPKDERNDEFSETEDFMVGINVVVNDEDAGGGGGGGGVSDYDDGDDTKAWYKEEDLHQAEEDLKEMEESTQHVCHLCQQPFPLRAILLQHLVTCRVMNADLEANAPVVAQPKKRAAKRKGNLQCTECDRTFIHRNSLVYHMRSHTGIRPHQCDQCGKSFFASSALKVHMRLHSGDKPYACSECEKRFRQWGDLKYHMTSIHSTEKNFQCEYCGKEFARKYSLIVHRRIHTGEKNYKCEFCGKTFRASSYLQNHRRIHTGEKPHSCDICAKPFRVRSDMKRHMRTHNRGPPAANRDKVVATAALAPVAGGAVHEVVLHQVKDEYVQKEERSDGEETTTTTTTTTVVQIAAAGADDEEEDDPTHQILAEYETDPLVDDGRELTAVRMNRNLYINGNELFLVTYPREMQE